jgi:hypothetical protein
MKEMSSNPSKERNSMKTSYTVTLAMLAGCAFGAAAVQGLHAQAKPPIYYVVEIDTTDQDAYAKEFAPKAQAIIKAAGRPLRGHRRSRGNRSKSSHAN